MKMRKKYILTGFYHLGLALLAFGMLAYLFYKMETSYENINFDINRNRQHIDTPDYYKRYLDSSILRNRK